MLALFAAALILPRFDVTFDSLVTDAVNLESLAEYPDPPYETRQASSYDRASVSAGVESWFANGDAGNFVRTEQHDDRKEHVMVDVNGPGVMVRYWSPNPGGTTRIYIDGAETPMLQAKTAELLGGKVQPFLPPVAQETSSGWSLYCPITYQKSLKVTVDDSENDAGKGMYYQIQYRTFAHGVSVEPFKTDSVASSKLVAKMGSVPSLPMTGNNPWLSDDLESSSVSGLTFSGPGVITTLLVQLPPEPKDAPWGDPRNWHNIFRNVTVKGSFDGEKCIDAPLGGLMSSTIGLDPLDSLPAMVTDTGLLVLRLPMPFKDRANLSFVNSSKVPVHLKVSSVRGDYVWTDRSMHLKAQWSCYRGSTRPMRDLSFLRTQGPGVYVGCNVSVSNPVAGWWGEGDEKIYLDNEAFPSTFGTGTEDFFGYGWCNPKLFEHPYHFQSRCDGPGNKGHTCLGRWQILDRLPFEKSFQFDMELWHWVDCNVTYGRTAFWYAKPGTPGPKSDAGDRFLPPLIEGAPKVKGAVEGETMKILSKTGGYNEYQEFDSLSNGKQLWWRNANVGDTLSLSVPVTGSGRFHVFGHFCFANDYGVQRIQFGDIDQTVDFYDKLGWKTVDLGTLRIKPGTTDLTFSVTVTGANVKAAPSHMFGLDYLLLVKE